MGNHAPAQKASQPLPAIANSQWVSATQRQQQERIHDLFFKRKKAAKKKEKILRCKLSHKAHGFFQKGTERFLYHRCYRWQLQ